MEEAEDGYSAIKLARIASADLMLLDIGPTRPGGMKTLRKPRKVAPEMKILVLSSDASMAEARTTLALGAAGFTPRHAAGDHFVDAFRKIAPG